MKWFYNLKISVKLIVSFLILSAITAFVGIQGLTDMGAINKMLSSLYHNETRGIAYIKESNSDLLAYSRCLNNYLLSTSQKERDNCLANLTNYEKLLFQNINAATPLIKSDEGKALIAQVEQQWNDYKKGVNQVIALGNFDSLAEKQKSIILLNTAVREKSNAIDTLFAELVRQKEKDGKEFYIQSNQDYADTRLYLIILIIGSLGFGIGLGLYISKIISKPINALIEASNKFAVGDLNVQLFNTSKDEVGELSTAFNNMLEKTALQIQYLDNIPNPVMIIDKEYNIQYMNQSGAKVLAKDQKQLIGQKCYEQFRTDHCRTENCALSRAMKNGSTFTDETIANPNGIQIPILYTGVPVKNKEGNIIGAMEEVINIKEIKELQNYLTRSTQNMLQAMDKFAGGDLTVKVIPEKENDDIGKLFLGFNQSVQNIGNIIREVTEAVSATASASTQISASSEEMAAGAQEQSSQSQEVSTAVDQMTRTILDTTKNAGSTADQAKNAGQIAEDGGKVISETIEGMNRIAIVVTKAAETVQELGKSSDQIGEIVQVIDDIADQTNLLALNAAIEAARAGEQGRGFAVVADEVRKLAERTTKATKEIADMIKRIQKETKGAVESIQQGTAEAQKGKSLAAKAGESLKQIITGSSAVLDRATQVAAASEEQSATAEQISRNIEAINNVAQESAAGVQQIARAAEDLNRLTDNLQNLVSRFNIDSERGNDRSTLAVRSNGHIVHAD